MSKMDHLYESKAMQKLQQGGQKISGSKVFGAIAGGMMGSLGLIMIGAVFTIIATLLSMTGLVQNTDPLYTWLTMPYNMTMGIISVAVAFMIAAIYAKSLGMKSMANGVISMTLFLLVAAPVQTVTLEGGATMQVLDSTYLGGTGLFTAILIALLSTRITKLCEDHHWVLKMPEVVPQFLQDSFSSIIPLGINVLLWHGLNTLVKMVFTVPLPMAIVAIFSLPLSGLISVPGMFIMTLIAMLLWSFGIHGTMVLYVVIMAPMMQYVANNAQLVANGQPPIFTAMALFGALACCGGTGNVLPLAALCVRSKSQQLRAVGKAGIVPALFNISEPVVFGAPIMYNPILAIPFILNPMVIMLFLYLGYMVDFFKPAYILIMTALPVFAQEFFATMAWQNLFIAPLGFLIGIIIYYPFFKVYERQLCEKEAAEAKAVEAEAKA